MMNDIPKDGHGQPLNRRLNRESNLKKSISTMCGVCRGILADGMVTEGEARVFREMVWKVEQAALSEGRAGEWPVPQLAAAVDGAFQKNRIDATGLASLKELMEKLSGTTEDGDGLCGGNSTALPLCVPAPAVVFEGRMFLLTGKFYYGSRRQVEEAILARGGLLAAGKNPTRETDFLLIGAMASRDWKQESYGRKIEKAVELRDEKKWKVRIIGEEHWERFL